MLIIPIRLPRLPRHDLVDPLAAKEGRDDVAQPGRNVQQADDELAVAVGGRGEAAEDADVGDEEGAKGDGGHEDGDGHGGEAQEEDDAEGVDEEALEAFGELLGVDFGGFRRLHAV